MLIVRKVYIAVIKFEKATFREKPYYYNLERLRESSIPILNFFDNYRPENIVVKSDKEEGGILREVDPALVLTKVDFTE